MMEATVFAYDEQKRLVKMRAGGVDSYGQAIDMAKAELKAPRALCLVDKVALSQAPTEELKEIA